MFQRYTTALLPLGVLILGVLTAANETGLALVSWQTIVQLVILVVTTGLSFWLPLVPGKWAGAAKTGAGIVGAIASALVATLPDGGHFTTATLLLFLTAALKAVATQVGVSIRTDATNTRYAGGGVVHQTFVTPTADNAASAAAVARRLNVLDPAKVSDGDPAIVGSEPTPAS